MAFGPTGDATCLRRCARLSIPANARACPHIKPSRRPFRLSALCSNRVEQLHLLERADGKNLPGTVQMDGDAPAVGVFKKTGRTFAPRKGEPVTLEGGDEATCGKPAERRVVNRHRS